MGINKKLKKGDIMRFAGIWRDMTDKEAEELKVSLRKMREFSDKKFNAILQKNQSKKGKNKKMDISRHREPQILIGGENLRQVVFGFEDGMVNVLGIATGVAAASASSSFVILAGTAGAIANSVSMAAGTYLSIKSQIEHYNMEIRGEIREIEEVPEIEREEIREIYRKKGFKGKDLKMIVKRITSDKKIWLDVMMKEELGLGSGSFPNPITATLIMTAAVVIGSIFPIMPFFFFAPTAALVISLILSGTVLFAAGALKGILTSNSWLKSGLEMLAVASLAAGATWMIGTLMGVVV